MIVGVIRTRDILLNPWTIISMKGIVGFFKLLFLSLSRKPHLFINMIENTGWVVVTDKK